MKRESTAELYARLSEEERAELSEEERAAVHRHIAERYDKIFEYICVGLLFVLLAVGHHYFGGGGYGRYSADMYDVFDQER